MVLLLELTVQREKDFREWKTHSLLCAALFRLLPHLSFAMWREEWGEVSDFSFPFHRFCCKTSRHRGDFPSKFVWYFWKAVAAARKYSKNLQQCEPSSSSWALSFVIFSSVGAPWGCALHVALLSTARQNPAAPVKCLGVSVMDITSGCGGGFDRSGWAITCISIWEAADPLKPSQAGLLLQVLLKDHVKMLLPGRGSESLYFVLEVWNLFERNNLKMTLGQKDLILSQAEFA